MSKPHKHAELIKAWADGVIIQEKYSFNEWRVFDGYWQEDKAYSYRIKPEPKPDFVVSRWVYPNGRTDISETPNIKLTFDASTGKLKSAEVL